MLEHTLRLMYIKYAWKNNEEGKICICILTVNVVLLSTRVHSRVRLDPEMVSSIPAVKFSQRVMFGIFLLGGRR